MPTVLPFTNQAAAPVSVAVPQQPAHRVFTTSFQERLAVLNAADRELRRLGFHIVWSRLAASLVSASRRMSRVSWSIFSLVWKNCSAIYGWLPRSKGFSWASGIWSVAAIYSASRLQLGGRAP